mgnify:CR=1 FL=1
MPSCHAEVLAYKMIESIKGPKAAQKATYICMRWSFNCITNDWVLNDGNPCRDCAQYLKKKNITKFIISTREEPHFKKTNIDTILENSKWSTGRKLCGKICKK